MENLTLAQLASLYNSVAEKPVAKFKDKPTGVARLQAQMTEKSLVLVLAEDGTPSLAPEGWDKVETSNEDGPVIPEGYETNEGEIGRWVQGDEGPVWVTLEAETSGDADHVEPTEAKRAGRVSKLMGKRITLVSATNPKRKDSATAKRFALYETGMTSDEYMDACLARELGTTREVLSDLAYDSKKGFIKLA